MEFIVILWSSQEESAKRDNYTNNKNLIYADWSDRDDKNKIVWRAIEIIDTRIKLKLFWLPRQLKGVYWLEHCPPELEVETGNLKHALDASLDCERALCSRRPTAPYEYDHNNCYVLIWFIIYGSQGLAVIVANHHPIVHSIYWTTLLQLHIHTSRSIRAMILTALSMTAKS